MNMFKNDHDDLYVTVMSFWYKMYFCVKHPFFIVVRILLKTFIEDKIKL